MTRTAAILFILAFTSAAFVTSASGADPVPELKTRHARIKIDDRGFITSLVSLQSGKEYSPAGHPSPLMSLHEYQKPNDQLVRPTSAVFNAARQEIELKYPNGAAAVVKASAKDDYFRFQLVSLTPRGAVDNIVWGPLHTTVSKLIGDMIGVVRDDDWAIGMMGIDDNTIAGPVTDGDCYGMGYYIHSPDPAKYPLPAKYKEGQWFNIGGNGISDTAFYSHPEEYFQQVFGNGARLEPEFGSTVAYHARDRNRSYVHRYSLLPGFPRSRPRYMVSDPVPGVDFIGSTVALYACPDNLGLATIEKIILAENLSHVVIGGKWIRDPTANKPDLSWGGPYDKLIEYSSAMNMNRLQNDTAEFYPSLDKDWKGSVGFSGGRKMSYKEFSEEASKNGLSFGGLHTLTVFLQGGISHDVTPVPSEHLQTVCRAKLAKDLSPADTEVVVVEPSFLTDDGTWTMGDHLNYARIGTEMIKYDGISTSAPWTLKNVKRGHASKAVAHKAGEELAKLMLNCYHGFVPDMKLLLDYADYYANLMHNNGMESIGFDGLESAVYQNHGYYAVRVFIRRLFDTYGKLTGGKAPRVTGSNVFAGAWEYMNACNVGGGNNMFDAIGNRWGIEGKDIRNGFSNSYYPATFGLQGYHSDWSVYDAENLEAKSIGWNATYTLSVSAAAIENSGEKDGILRGFHAWEAARAAGVFSPAQKKKLRDTDFKFHLEQTGEKSFILYPVRETRVSDSAGREGRQVTLTNVEDVQPLQFSLQVDSVASGCVVLLPDGAQIKCDRKIEKNQFIICKGSQACLADNNRKKIADLPLPAPAMAPKGEFKLGVQFAVAGAAKTRFNLTVWITGKSEPVTK